MHSQLSTLPPLISYTPVVIPLSSAPDAPRTQLRRDLFDARFQVISQDQEAEDEEGARLTAGDKGKGKERRFEVDEATDLVRGVYEGGLKTWECSLDLVDCLDGLGYGTGGESSVRGRSFLEVSRAVSLTSGTKSHQLGAQVGCGTSLPSCSIFAKLLEELFKSPSDPDGPRPKVTRIHLQDYNQQGAFSRFEAQGVARADRIHCSVLSLITLPNLLLTYAQHLASEAPSTVTLTAEDAEVNPGELDVTPEFLESFESLLQRENVELRFFEGDWSGMVVQPEVQHYDVVLTSETIYSLDSLPFLLSLLQTTCRPTSDHPSPAKCLVACKRIYFGVGGGELEFRRRVEERGGKVESIWGAGEGEGKSKGVGRVVMNVDWN